MQWIDYTSTRRDRRADQEADIYGTLYEAEDDRRRREWEAEFDMIPYRSIGADIHRIVMQRMATLREGA
jgi:hypothetical protein